MENNIFFLSSTIFLLLTYHKLKNPFSLFFLDLRIKVVYRKFRASPHPVLTYSKSNPQKKKKKKK